MEQIKDSKSPSLVAISRERPNDGFERRNLPRLSVTSEQFRLSETGKIYSVNDLSAEGMGLWIVDREDLPTFRVGQVLEGTLNLKREKYPIIARVRNLSRDRIGCQFEKLSPAVQTALKQLLDPAILGSELKPIPASEMSTLWYHAPSGTDLLLKRQSDGKYHRLTLYVLGSFIQWDEEQGLVTGRTVASDERSELRGILRLETLFLDPDLQPDPNKLSIAKTVVLSSNLPQDLKHWCIRQLER